ncbi:hypothetical protein EYC59_06130 [Candidatus Saccharibacteria bacterium]|nr:MAG: hypothetical protein EYC59_06130 [Candidatus Saccharibacteria bacterium]
MLRSRRNKSTALFPLSVEDNLGSEFEQEYERLGEQGMARKYGSRLVSSAVFPELDNTPFFGTDELAADSHTAPSDLGHVMQAQATLDDFESGKRSVGEAELARLNTAVTQLMLAEAADDNDAITVLATNVRKASDAWQSRQ